MDKTAGHVTGSENEKFNKHQIKNKLLASLTGPV